MKKLQIPIDDELMKDLKQIAAANGITLKEMVTRLLEHLVKGVKNNGN
jgi:hypothetical protein